MSDEARDCLSPFVLNESTRAPDQSITFSTASDDFAAFRDAAAVLEANALAVSASAKAAAEMAANMAAKANLATFPLDLNAVAAHALEAKNAAAAAQQFSASAKAAADLITTTLAVPRSASVPNLALNQLRDVNVRSRDHLGANSLRVNVLALRCGREVAKILVVVPPQDYLSALIMKVRLKCFGEATWFGDRVYNRVGGELPFDEPLCSLIHDGEQVVVELGSPSDGIILGRRPQSVCYGANYGRGGGSMIIGPEPECEPWVKVEERSHRSVSVRSPRAPIIVVNTRISRGGGAGRLSHPSSNELYYYPLGTPDSGWWR